MNSERIADFDYHLPEAQIAQVAIEPRDAAKLLVYKKGTYSDSVFNQLPQQLPSNAHLVFNNAKVIQARLFAKTQTQAKIEVFLLKPHAMDYTQALSSNSFVEWVCMIGNKKKWKVSEPLTIYLGEHAIVLIQKSDNVVRFEWQHQQTFAELLEAIGQLPLPPYIKHQPSEHDLGRYQTVFSSIEGSVAAPTAGLHFTIDVLDQLKSKGFQSSELTLHVSAGTFLPVKAEQYRDHDMHNESYELESSTLLALKHKSCLVAVGTTATRVLESVYWAGIRLLNGEAQFTQIPQFVYELPYTLYAKDQVIDALLDYMKANGLSKLYGSSAIMIVPGYGFKMVNGLLTNFHQPKSTLLLLISAFIGDDWRKVYAHALAHNYRFLSYGDASLLLP